MTRHRTTRRTLFPLLFAAVAGAVAAGSSARAAARPEAVPRLVFPVVGPARYSDDFGDARGSGRHEGIDIVAPKRAIAVAAEAGTVKFHTTSRLAGCMLYLHGKSGTEYLYVHLNNDVTARNDNRGACVPGVAYARGLMSGAGVVAGQAIVYGGDSGDADAVGISTLSGAHMTLVPRIVEGLRENDLEDVLVVVGGTIPNEDAETLKELGVAEVFTPGTPTSEIVEFLRARVPA